MIAPTFTALETVSKVTAGSRVSLGAQNLYWEKEGAYTGEISADMLTAVGCQYVIIGHSERRQFFGDTDDAVNHKIKAALEAGIIPVMCVGETVQERDAGQTFSVLDKQVKSGLHSYVADDLATLVIAYEPVWAIGTGVTATPEQAQEVHAFIRKRLGEHFGVDWAEKTRILYGGSMKPGNAADLLAQGDIDGGLIGGASLSSGDFLEIIRAAQGA
jgi:triosephosphate isomerase